MKTIVKFIWVALALAIGATSCSEEYWEEVEAKKEQARIEKVSAYWDVVGKLVSSADRTDDYADKIFEPIIGSADPSDPQTRIVATNDVQTARQRFANLINEDVSKIGSSYTYKNDEVGTLVYSESGGNSLATVDVNIKQIPHLSRIRYATPEQKGENGKFEGAAYYRFGDVISIEAKDGRTEYWVCVRPAFGKEGKQNTHWVTVSPVGYDNMLTYPSTKSSNKKEYNIQDKLKYDTEHLQNFAEMLYAICYPNKWHDNITDIAKMTMFHDFDKANIQYHNEAFWQNVQTVWKRDHVPEKLFGDFRNVMWLQEAMKDDGPGLYLLYGKSTWHWVFYNGFTVNQAHFYNTPGGVNSNMHTAKPYSEVYHDVIYKKEPSRDIEYNILVESTLQHPWLVKPAFFGDDNPRFIVRYAEGCELSSTGKYGDNDVRSPIPGSTTVYRYYQHAYPVTDLSNSDLYPEVSKPLGSDGSGAIDRKDVKPGYLIGADGKFYASDRDCRAVTTPAALVMYVGETGSVESGTDYAGLAMSLSDLPGGNVFQLWGDEDDSDDDPDECKLTVVDEYDFTQSQVQSQLNGLSTTKDMAAGCGKRHTHKWAKDCATFNVISSRPASFSEWFVPSVGQWRKALLMMGLEKDDSHRKYVEVSDMKDKLQQYTNSSTILDFGAINYISTSSYKFKNRIIVMKTSNSQFISGYLGMLGEGNTNVKARPFIAFK